MRYPPRKPSQTRYSYEAILLTFLLIASITPISSALQPRLKDLDYLPTGVLALHIRGFASTSPKGAFTASLRKQPGAEGAYFRLAEVLEEAVQESNCFLRDGGWAQAAADYYKLRGWEPANGACSSSTAQNGGENRFNADESYERRTTAGNFADKVKTDVMKATVKNFTRVVHPRSFPYEFGSKVKQTCTTERTTGLRVKLPKAEPLWYVLTGITNEVTTVDLEAWKRQYVTELVGVDLATKKFVDPKLHFIKPFGDEGEQQNRSDFATAFEMWSGRVGSSAVLDLPINESPAVILAVERMDLAVDQARDAVTASNVAILALPMIINLIPVALLADVTTFGLLFYTLITDIVTTVPFIIKGFELIAMGMRDYSDQAVWFRGKSSEELVLAELWATKCRILRVRTLGIIFVAVGFTFMFLGILAEVLARRLRRKWGTQQRGNSQRALRHLKVALLGGEQIPVAESANVRELTSSFDSGNEEAQACASSDNSSADDVDTRKLH